MKYSPKLEKRTINHISKPKMDSEPPQIEKTTKKAHRKDTPSVHQADAPISFPRVQKTAAATTTPRKTCEVIQKTQNVVQTPQLLQKQNMFTTRLLCIVTGAASSAFGRQL